MHQLSNQGPSTSSERLENIREALVKQVWRIWVAGILEKSIYRQVYIDLDLETSVDTQVYPWHSLVETPGHTAVNLSSGSDLVNALEEHGSLLIIGAAGAGKTTMLLDLAKHLLDAARSDKDKPIPVVFQLASWAVTRKPLAEWLADELVGDWYGVRREVAEKWIHEEMILPLLDGLDEVVSVHRPACAKAIRDFRNSFRLLPLVVCSRAAENDALEVGLDLPVTIRVQPLTREKVNDYLRRIGNSVAGVDEALQADPTLWELLNNPFILSLTISAYQGSKAGDIGLGDSLDERRHRLFETFIKRALRRKSNVNKEFSSEHAVRWLSYLARGLGQRFEQVFYVEFINASWLPSASSRRSAIVLSALPAGVFTGLGSGIVFGLMYGSLAGFIIGSVFGISVSLTMALGSGTDVPFAEGPNRQMRVASQVASQVAEWWIPALALSGIIGFIFFVIGLVPGLLFGAFSSEPFLSALWLISGFAGAVGIVLGLLISAPLFQTLDSTAPNNLPPGGSIRVAAWSTVLMSASVALPTAIIFAWWHGIAAAVAGIGLGAAVAYLGNGRAYVQYWVTRVYLARFRLAPLRLLDFLEFTTTAMITFRIGGGYFFHHRLLLEHFSRLPLTGVPEKYISGGLPGIDLRPKQLLEYAMKLAEHSPSDAARALAFVAPELHPEEFAPVAFEIASSMSAAVSRRLNRSRMSHSSIDHFYALERSEVFAAMAIYGLVVRSNHAELGFAAAMRGGELINGLIERRETFETPDGGRLLYRLTADGSAIETIRAITEFSEDEDPQRTARAKELLAKLAANGFSTEFLDRIN
ncbi:hypothetical protein Ait01nite_030730 [Actinoplanes italicus]|nr:NACHT domain-containing protein [Actinoplanes italicus]GIE30028.1 hypothetical protein Ait01nite_030730 [Actinoplanes italicus]